MNNDIQNEIEILEQNLGEAISQSGTIKREKKENSELFKIRRNRLFKWPMLASVLAMGIFILSGDVTNSIFLFSFCFSFGMLDFIKCKRLWKSIKGGENQLYFLNIDIEQTREDINTLRTGEPRALLTERRSLEKQKELLKLWYKLGTYDGKKIPVERIKMLYQNQNVLSEEDVDFSIAITRERKRYN